MIIPGYTTDRPKKTSEVSEISFVGGAMFKQAKEDDSKTDFAHAVPAQHRAFISFTLVRVAREIN